MGRFKFASSIMMFFENTILKNLSIITGMVMVGAIIWIFIASILAGIYIMIPFIQNTWENSKVAEFIVGKSVVEAVAYGEESATKILFKKVLIKNTLLIIVILVARIIVFDRILG